MIPKLNLLEVILRFLLRTTRVPRPCLLALALLSGLLTTTQAQESKVTLARIEAAVKPVLKGLSPAPKVGYSEQTDSFEVDYRTQKFLVHGRSMTGEWSTNALPNVGPSSKGFTLRAYLQRSGEVNQAVTPQTLREPYWHTFLQVTPIAGTSNQLYWALSYGDQADEKVLEALKKALAGLASNPGGSERQAR